MASCAALRVIECLKASGLEIREIRQFMEWCKEGPATYGVRRELFEKRREAVLAEMDRLQLVLAMIDYKCWYYTEAERAGSEEALLAMLPDKLPPEMQAAYDASHC